MSIFKQKQQTEAKARSRVAWPFRFLAMMAILMGMLLASPQVEAAEPTVSVDGPYLVASSQPTTIVVVPLEYGVMPDLSNEQQITASPSCRVTQRPGLRMLSNGDFLAFWPNCYSRFKHNSNGTFTEVDLGRPPTDWNVSMSADDLNGDGRDDLLLVRRVSPSLVGPKNDYQYKVALGQADGSFDFNSRPTTFAKNQWGAHITLGDANGDGNADLVYHSFSSGGQFTTQIYMLAGNGDGTFAQVRNKQLVLTAPRGVSSTRALLGDFNADKQTDIFLPPDDDTHDMGQAYIALNNIEKNFTIQQSIDFRPRIESRRPDIFSASALTCDVDLDGKLDLIAYSSNLRAKSGSLSIHSGHGDGHFEQDGHVLREGPNPQTSLACFSPPSIEPVSIEVLDDGTEIAARLISVVVKSGDELNNLHPDYEWVELERTPLFGGDNEAILYQIEPLGFDEPKYDEIIKWLSDNNPPIECAGTNPVFSSPNIWVTGGAENMASWLNPDPNTFRNQWVFEQINLPNQVGGDQGQDVIVAFLDTFQPDVETLWLPHTTYYYDVYENGIPGLQSRGKDISVHGDMAMSLSQHLTPQSELWPIRVMNQSGQGYSFAIIDGLNQVIEQLGQHPGKQLVINMSLGLVGSPSDDDCSIEIINKLLQEAEAKGIVVVAAAGNDADDQNPSNPPPEPQYPASVDTVSGVAASNSFGLPASYSNQGDVMAPGGDISGFCSSDPTDACFKKHGIIGRIPTDSGYQGIAWEGTSFAAPVVSGLAANLLSCNPDLRANQVRYYIKLKPRPNPNLGDTNNLINVQNALAAAGCVSDSPDPLDVRLLCDVSSTFCDAIVSGGSGGYQFTWQGVGGATIVNDSGSRATIDPGRCPSNPSVVVQVTDSSGNSSADRTPLQCNPRGIGGPSPIP